MMKLESITKKYLEDLLFQSDVYRIVALGFEPMDWLNQSIFFENLEDFLSIDSGQYEIYHVGLYRQEIEILKRIRFYKEIPLESEYHKLFSIQNSISYSEGSFVKIEKGNVIGDVLAFYRAVDFPIKLEGSGSPDTISKETGFISFLLLKEFFLIQDSSLNDIEKEEKWNILKELRYKFLNEHYLRWVPEFIKMCMENATHPFYTDLILLLQKMIEKIH